MNAKPASAEYILKAKQGDLEAFNRLVLEHQDEVYSLASRVLCDEKAALEATRIVFQIAYRDLASYRSGSFRLWLLRIAARACLSELHGWHAQYRTPPVVLTSTPEGGLWACLRLVPPDLRLSLVLVDMEGLDYTEAAAVLDASPKKVQARLAQARQWMVQSQAVGRPASA